jgi:hypothetical protein
VPFYARAQVRRLKGKQKQKKKIRGRNVSCQSIERNSWSVQYTYRTHPFFKLVFIKGKALTTERKDGKEKIGEEKGQRTLKDFASFSLRDRILASF